jgi:hypothetical protein
MANSSWKDVTNKCLELRGQLQITSANNFNNPTTLLTRVQSEIRAFVDMCDRMLNVRRNNRDTTQEFQITTEAGNPTVPSTFQYTLDASVRVESIRYISFFNITPQVTNPDGSVSMIVAQPLYNTEYREFRRIYPDFTAISTGPPQNWIILPKSQIQPGPGIINDTIMFFPIPDAVYKINYQATTKAVPLKLDTDPVLWPPEYEHILWHWACMYLEDALGEGKGQLMSAYAQQALTEYNFWINRGPEEERHAVRTGMAIFGPLRGRRTSAYSDTPTQST